MEQSQQASFSRHRGLARYLPGIITGVFLARLLGELVGLPGLWAAIALSAVFSVACGWLTAHWSINRTWPAFMLIVYIIFPELNFVLAVQVVAVTTVATLLNEWFLRGRQELVGRRVATLIPALIGIASFALYWSTLAPDVLPADSGELQVVAAQLGVAHPPGFPLYVIAAHLFTRLLPFFAPAYAVNLFSAATSALTVSIVYLCVITLTGGKLPAVIAAVALATATTYWSQATTANVRSLTGLFAALIILALLHFRLSTLRGDLNAADHWLVLAALFMGFGLTHHVSLLFLILVGVLFILLTDRTIIRTPRRWIRPAIAALLGLIPLIYLPYRASADVRGASPDLASWSGFLEHALATGFRGDLFYYLAPGDLWQRLRIMANVLTFQFATIVLIAIVVGTILLIWRERLLAFLLAGTFLLYSFVAATYRAPQTVEYMIPAYIIAAMLLGYAIGWLPQSMKRFRRVGEVTAILFSALVIVGVTSQFRDNISASGAEHEATAAREYARRLLNDTPADGVILAHWHWVTPLWYLQEVEGIRPDLDIRFVFPEGESYGATWVRRTSEAIAGGDAVVTTWVPSLQPVGLPIPEPIGEALLYPQVDRTELPPGFTSADLLIGDSVEILGYRVDLPMGTLTPGDEAEITVAWRPTEASSEQTGLFVHLVGADYIIYGQDDRLVVPAPEITLTQFRVTPRPGTPAGTMSLMIGVAGTSTDRQLLTEVDITNNYRPFYSRNKVERAILAEDANILIGYDWDHSLADHSRLYLHWRRGENKFFTQVVDDEAIDVMDLLPYKGPWGVPVSEWRFPHGRDGGHYIPFGQGIIWTGETLNGLSLKPGESVVIATELRSSQPINRDYIVSLRLIGLESNGIQWAWWDLEDSVPAMGAIPTLKWVVGSFVRSPHRVAVSESAVPGQELAGALTLYDSFTNRLLPILDERITAENPWIPLCRAVVE